jgi:hypothetical protein
MPRKSGNIRTIQQTLHLEKIWSSKQVIENTWQLPKADGNNRRSIFVFRTRFHRSQSEPSLFAGITYLTWTDVNARIRDCLLSFGHR